MTRFSGSYDQHCRRRRRIAIMLAQPPVEIPSNPDPVDAPPSLGNSLPAVVDSAAELPVMVPPPADYDPVLLNRLRQGKRVIWVFTGDSLLPPREKKSIEGTLASIVGRRLRRKLPFLKTTLCNTTASGLRLLDLLDDYDRRIGRFDLDVLSLTFGPVELSQPSGDLLELEDRCLELIQRVQSRGAIPIVNLPPWFPPADPGQRIHQQVRVAGLRASSLEAGAFVVDHWSHWESAATPEWYRGSLPSRTGREQMVRQMFRELHLDSIRSSRTPVSS